MLKQIIERIETGGHLARAEAEAAMEELLVGRVKHELIVLSGINHSFVGKTPEQICDANLKALAATFQFIDRTVGNGSSTDR